MSRATRATAPWACVCYGVDDVGGCMVRAERHGRRVCCEAVAFDSAILAAAVDNGAAVACGMPVGAGIAAWVRAPFGSVRKARRVFPTLLDIQLPFSLESCVYGFTECSAAELVGGDASDGTPGVSALAIAAPKANVRNRLNVLAAEGIDPHVLDHEGVALWTQSLCEHEPNDKSAFRAVVFLRDEDAILVIGRGAGFLSSHRIHPVDGKVFDRYLLAQTVQMVSGDGGVPAVSWLWGGKGLGVGDAGAGLRRDVEQRWPGSSVTLDEPESFLARALATRALLPGPLRSNLRVAELVHAHAQSREHGMRIRSALFMFLAGVLLCGMAFWWNVMLAARQADLAHSFGQRLERVVGYRVPARGGDALLIAERELEQRRADSKPLVDMFRPSLLQALNGVLSVVDHQDMLVEYFEVSPFRLVVKGSSPSVDAPNRLQSAVNDMGYESEVVFGEEAGGVIAYALDATREAEHE